MSGASQKFSLLPAVADSFQNILHNWDFTSGGKDVMWCDVGASLLSG